MMCFIERVAKGTDFYGIATAFWQRIYALAEKTPENRNSQQTFYSLPGVPCFHNLILIIYFPYIIS